MDHLTYKKQLAEGLKNDSAIDAHAAIRAKIDEVFQRKLNLIKEQGDQRNAALEVMMAAKSFGGEDADEHNGVIVIYFRSKQGAEHFSNYLEGCDVVETYEMNGKWNNRTTDAAEDVVDFDSINDDRAYEFQVIVYLYPEYSEFNADYDEDGDEDGEDSALEDQVEEGFDPLVVVECETIDESTFVVKHDGVNDDHPDADVKKLFAGKKDVINHVTKNEDSATKIKALLQKKGFNNVRIEKNGKVMENEQIDEVSRKIRVSSRGVKSIKMQCAQGFRWDPHIEACVKITGQELAVMRKASRRALITKKSEGSAFKVRLKRRIKRAFKFRQMMGMKV